MKTGFIIYLTNKKAKKIRKGIESLHAVKELGKQPTAVV